MTTASGARADLVSWFAGHAAVRELARKLAERKRCVCLGSVGSSTALVAGAIARGLERPVVLVVAHLDDADEACEELIASGVQAVRVPALEASPGESAIAADLLAARLRLARTLPTLAGPSVVLASIQALMQSVPHAKKLETVARTIRKGDRVSLNELANWLQASGYKRMDAVEEPGDFALRGGILDVFPTTPATLEASGDAMNTGGDPVPVRLDFFGDEVDRLCEIDVETMGADRTIEAVEIIAANAGDLRDDGNQSILELISREAVVVLAETMEIVEQGRGYFERISDSKGIFGPPAVLKLLESRFHALAEINQFSAGGLASDVKLELPVQSVPMFSKDAYQAIVELAAIEEGPPKTRVVVICQNDGEKQRLGELVAEHAPDFAKRMDAVVGYLHRGVIVGGCDAAATRSAETSVVALIPYHELMSRFTVRRSARIVRSQRAMDTFLDFDEGDYVVHQEHGISRYMGMKLMAPRELPVAQRAVLSPVASNKRAQEQEEYLVLEFAGASKLYVPATQVDRVQKYVGGFSGKPQLSTLGGQKWKHQKERVAESVKDLAGELLRVRAAREHLPGISYPNDTTWQKEFEDEFPYEETADQLAALQEIKRDMHAKKPMDRLLCGDVGFGKTELAIRAAFKAAEFGRQVAVLVPTTVLAEQHERTFRSRFAGYPFKVESISRFKTDLEVKDVLSRLRKGQVDVVIGTHRLLSQDVVFADLGLVVVDEEQRFGVEHKEGLLRLRLTVDVLTLSATPIPRTLHMAMLGIRDISSLTTAPADRRAIVTEVIPYNPIRIRQAIERELAREGQVYFVHNRVHDIQSVADDIQRLAPDAKIVIGHGQMNPHELEEVMLKFIRREADILVATTIIESGIDIASANTMIINDADRFGLSDLHQLRGRVGRSKHRGYCYLLLPVDRALKETAQKRLKALEQYSMLGAGFKIAMRDLEIRGAGNILGAEQSGHIAAVGYEMYCRLLEDAVHTLNNDPKPEPPSSTTVEIGIGGLIPKAYIPSDKRRLAVYRRVATATTMADLEQALKDIRDAYGMPPAALIRLVELAQLRLALSALQVRGVTIRDKDVIFFCKHRVPVAAALAARVETQSAAAATIRPLAPEQPGGLDMVYFRPPESYLEPGTLLMVLRKRLGLAPVHVAEEVESAAEAAPSVKPVGKRRPPPPRGTRAKHE
ncbi:MAG: transcription-repair coupling factor [Phycisphaerae bacterium]|jgi:transcription-repair coupling factor (superfamily II helicase)